MGAGDTLEVLHPAVVEEQLIHGVVCRLRHLASRWHSERPSLQLSAASCVSGEQAIDVHAAGPTRRSSSCAVIASSARAVVASVPGGM
jgi:hypothetical protein